MCLTPPPTEEMATGDEKKTNVEDVKSDLYPERQLVETADGKKWHFWNKKLAGKTSKRFPTAEGI